MTKILTVSNPKMQKSVQYGYLSAIVHLKPHRHKGRVLCPNASEGCIATCLHVSGAKFIQPKKERARGRRTALLLRYPLQFWQRFLQEAALFARRAARKDLIPVIRVRGTHDLRPPSWVLKRLAILGVKTYDYTKNWKEKSLPDYPLTFSKTENHTMEDVAEKLAAGHNVAIVFDKNIPKTYCGFGVIDGTVSDLRFLDSKGVIVGLRALARAKKDATGFVVRDHEGPFIAKAC